MDFEFLQRGEEVFGRFCVGDQDIDPIQRGDPSKESMIELS